MVGLHARLVSQTTCSVGLKLPEMSISEVLFINVIHKRLKESGTAEMSFSPEATEVWRRVFL